MSKRKKQAVDQRPKQEMEKRQGSFSRYVCKECGQGMRIVWTEEYSSKSRAYPAMMRKVRRVMRRRVECHGCQRVASVTSEDISKEV